MPGSLLLSNNAYSDVSDTSCRSLDSKISPKKVSFNNAVRVKQYSWKPDLEQTNGNHLTLPNNKFWFKVYKNKQDTPIEPDPPREPYRKNAWCEDTVECIRDSLAPIAEVEDQEFEIHSPESRSNFKNYEYTLRSKQSPAYYSANCKNPFKQPIEPPVDYFDEMRLNSNCKYNKTNSQLKSATATDGRCNYNSNSTTCLRSSGDYNLHYGTLEESEEDSIRNKFSNRASTLSNGLRLSRMTVPTDSSPRRSARNLNHTSDLNKRERRSRSQDDYVEYDTRFKQLKKADKSVSTEDLNGAQENGFISNIFLRESREMGTQCYGLLTRKNMSDFGKLSSPSYVLRSENERLNSFKNATSTKTVGNESPAKAYPFKKNNHEDNFTSHTSTHQDYETNKGLIASERSVDYKKYNSISNSMTNNVLYKGLTRSENFIPVSVPSDKKLQSSRTNFQASTVDTKQKLSRDSVTVGYLRGRQIPLSEVNTNMNRKVRIRNENNATRNSFSQKNRENGISTSFHIPLDKTETRTSNGQDYKKYFSPNFENNNKTHESDCRSSKFNSKNNNYNSMIDWSLSGFQLTTKTDNCVTSMSDSEYTVHRREPLLMYIPGVSHHDQPAIEDDRMSALSDISRSEISDRLGSILGSSTKGSPSDIRRHYSMPRNGKRRWVK